MKKYSRSIFLMVFFAFNAFSAYGQGEKNAVLKNCQILFGESVYSKLNLFEVNRDFVLKPEFNDKSVLVKISVKPKYYYQEENPEWIEPKDFPLLTNADFNDVITKINSIQTLGKFLREVTNGAVTNSTIYRIDFYENAHLEYGEYGPTKKEQVRFIRIDYFQDVTAKIVRKKSDASSQGTSYLVNIGELNFWVEEETFNKLTEGQIESFRGVSAPDNINIERFGEKLEFNFELKKKKF